MSEINILLMSSTRVATAVRAGNGGLKLIVWDVSAAGQITRKGDSGDQAGEARFVRVARLPSGDLVTAVRAGNGSLEVDRVARLW